MTQRAVLCTTSFRNSTKKRFSEAEVEHLVERIESDPCDGEEVPGLDGLRLLPWPSRSSGKLVWHQIAFLYIDQFELVYLLDVLDCNQEALPTHQDKLDAIDRTGRIIELAARTLEIVIRIVGS